jgi:PAS domain-containing protein
LHEAEIQLMNSEKRSRLLAENAWEVIWTMDLDGKVTYINPAVERVRGFTPEEAMLQSPEEIQPPESAAIGADYYQRLFASIEAGTEPPIFRGERAQCPEACLAAGASNGYTIATEARLFRSAGKWQLSCRTMVFFK